MDATQMISDSFLESDDEESEEENGNERGQPMAKLCILKNQHISETELPLFLGDNVLGRDDNTCTLPLQAPSVSKQHATISISAFKRKGCDNEVEIEALVWDLGSMNGTRKGRLKLSPNVRYALSEQDSLVVADIPCKFVSCIADVGDTRASERKQNGVNAETVTEPKARVSSPEDKRNTPLRHSCLSVEQTPVQLQASLVPESDSDSDGERHKALVSNTDSSKSSPSCSTFLSSFNKTISESEDESPITPSSFTKNRSNKHVSFSKEEIDMDVERQQLKEKKALEFLDDSEDEGEREEERAAPAGKTSEDSGKDVPVKLDNNVSLKREDELPVSVPAAITHALPALNMDSDTDMEGEEEGVTSVSPMALKTNQKADQLVDTVHFHMDSDTDVDEDDGTSDKLPKCVPPSVDTKPPHAVSVVQPEGITMDSDTDVDDDDAVSDSATKAKPVSFHSPHTVDSVLSTQPKDFHLDSDTDVDDEEEKECGTSTTGSKRDNVSMTSDIKPSVPESASAAPHGSQDAATPTPAVSEPSAVSAVTKPCTTADKEADMGTLSDSDTDVEEESPLVIPVVIASLSVPSAKSETPQPVTDADTDKDESRAPPAKGSDFDFDFDMDCDTDVEDEKGGLREVGDGQTPSLCRENTPALLAPPLHSCSTPVSSLERQVEEMETQAFLSPSSGPCRSTASLKPKTLSHESDSNEDEDFIVAETQSFVLQTREGQSNPAEEATQAFGLDSTGGEKGELSAREGSFQLGLSDSSHQQGPARALAMESTQAFVSVEGGVTVEETQAYATNFDTDSVECDSNLEATQLYEEDKEDVRGSAASKKEGRVDLALEATQAYISEPCCDSEDESDDRKSTASAETQPLDFPTSSTLAMAETQPVTSFDEEEVFVEGDHVSTVKVNTRSQNETKGGGEHEEAANPQEVPFSKALSVAETQPMCTSDNEENDDDDEEEDSVPGPRKRKAKRLHIQDEESQTRTNSEVSAFETQPMETAGDPESDEDDSVPGPRKRKAKRLHIQDEESQTLTNSEVSAVETQPMVTGEKGESDEEDSFPSRRKRNPKPLESQEEETQPIANLEASAAETQPMKTNPRTQSGRGKGRQSEAGTDGANIRSRRGSRRLEEKQEESSETPTRQTRGKNRALPSTGGRRGKPRPDETEEEEHVEQEKKTRGNKSTKQQSDNKMKEDVREMKRTKKEQEKLKMEKQEKEEQERLQAENAERLRLELERAEEERMERERKEKEEKERLDCEKAEREEKERKRQEEKERADKAQKEKEEQLAREATKKIEKERLEREKAEIQERERLEREEKDKLEKERKEQEEKERLETAKREQEERERQAKEERERQEKKNQEKEAKEKQMKEQEEKNKKDNKTEAPARSGRATRRTIAVPSATPNSNIINNDDDDVPARRTRSRSNSSNSVSSERSASSVNTQEVRGRGRGRGAKRSNDPPPAATPRSSNRRRTMAEGPTQQEGGHIPPQGALSRSSSTNSLAEISSCSPVSQRGTGGRQRGRGKKSEADPIPPNFSQSDQSSAPKPVARGRKSRRAEESLNEAPDEDNNEKVNSLPVGTTRGRQQASTSVSESAAADEEGPSNQKSARGEETPVPKRNVRGQKTVKNEPVEAQVAPAASDADQSQRKGQKRELQAKTEEPCSSSKIPKGKDKAQPKKSEEEETNSGAKDETPVQTKRRGRASTAQAKKESPPESEKTEKIKEEPIVRKVGGRRSAVQKKKGEQEESGSSVEQDTPVEASEPQTPTSTARRKRQSSTDSSPAAKTPRTTSASPAPGARSRASSQIYKVLFTGVVDEAGERVLARLGGGMAKGVADMNCLVTDKVRRTVKFLCAVAKGVPIVNTHWLEKSGKAGSFLSPDSFVVKDPEQEKKFNFCLQESLRTASSQPLLQGYEIYVTKSVKPEPVHMKDIISCSGATFLPKMPSSHKPQTVVISCEEDLSLCGPAFSASLPVVTAEFILTGILQQKLDLQTHSLSAPAASLKTAGGRGRKKT